MYWYSTAVSIGLYTRYILYLGTCTSVHGSLLLYNMHIYIYIWVTTTAVCVCRTTFVCVCMPLTTGQGCQSCSWSAAKTGKMSYSLSSFAAENLVSRDGFGGPRVSLLISILQAEF